MFVRAMFVIRFRVTPDIKGSLNIESREQQGSHEAQFLWLMSCQTKPKEIYEGSPDGFIRRQHQREVEEKFLAYLGIKVE